MSKFNISAIAVAATSFLHLRGPDDSLLYDQADGEKRKIGITLYGPGSAQYQSAVTRRQNAAYDRMRKGKKLTTTTEDRLSEQADFLAACTAGFDNFDYDKAGDATGTTLYRALYSDPELLFVADQVNAHLGDWENFTKPSPTT